MSVFCVHHSVSMPRPKGTEDDKTTSPESGGKKLLHSTKESSPPQPRSQLSVISYHRKGGGREGRAQIAFTRRCNRIGAGILNTMKVLRPSIAIINGGKSVRFHSSGLFSSPSHSMGGGHGPGQSNKMLPAPAGLALSRERSGSTQNVDTEKRPCVMAMV